MKLISERVRSLVWIIQPERRDAGIMQVKQISLSSDVSLTVRCARAARRKQSGAPKARRLNAFRRA